MSCWEFIREYSRLRQDIVSTFLSPVSFHLIGNSLFYSKLDANWRANFERGAFLRGGLFNIWFSLEGDYLAHRLYLIKQKFLPKKRLIQQLFLAVFSVTHYPPCDNILKEAHLRGGLFERGLIQNVTLNGGLIR